MSCPTCHDLGTIGVLRSAGRPGVMAEFRHPCPTCRPGNR
jgi:hypothetical protein